MPPNSLKDIECEQLWLEEYQEKKELRKQIIMQDKVM